MSTTAVSLRQTRATAFWYSTTGKKIVMAITGAILFLFVIGHMIGNLQIFEGRERLNAYGHLLHSLSEPLWAVRAILIISAVLPMITPVQLALHNKAARPTGYSRREAINSSFASRTMYWS